MKTFPKSRALCFVLTLLAALAVFAPAAAQTKPGEEPAQPQIERAKIFREAYPLISETDFYCSIYVHEGDLPALRIGATERGDEKILLSDADLFYVNRGGQDALEVGQVFLVIEVGQDVGGFGRLATRRGRAQVVFLEEKRAVARVEKSCGQVMVGNFLLPFEEKESLLGKDLGYEAYSKGDSGIIGNIIYTQGEYNQIGSGGWAIIDIGADAGIMVGQQMTIFKKQKGDLPREVVGNLVVIDTQPKTATVKVLSCNDPVYKGLLVQAK
jgi:hypothetical protein